MAPIRDMKSFLLSLTILLLLAGTLFTAPANAGTRLLPKAKFVPVPDSGHLMQEDAPEAIVATVIAFLGEIKPAA